MSFRLAGASSPTFSMDDARAAVAGYAFGTLVIATKLQEPSYGVPPTAKPRRRWAYASYDCIPASPGPELSDLDLLVASGLNSRLDVASVNSLLDVRDEVSEALREIPPGLRFWDLRREDIAADGEPGPKKDSPAWHVHRAWWLLMSSLDLSVATTHKVLHHKLPGLVPLLDNKTLAALPARGAWRRIYDDVTGQAVEFEHLEQEFAAMAAQRNAPPLTRLRLHDILLWLHVTGEDVDAIKAGKELK